MKMQGWFILCDTFRVELLFFFPINMIHNLLGPPNPSLCMNQNSSADIVNLIETINNYGNLRKRLRLSNRTDYNLENSLELLVANS